jgi:hypothetical protein
MLFFNKLMVLIGVSLIFISCSIKSNEPVTHKPPNGSLTNQLNPEWLNINGYNSELIPDTNGCHLWIGINEKRIDSLKNELVIIKKKGNLTVLFSPKLNYHLWPCNFPDLLKDEHTIILDCDIFGIGKNERLPGNPILIKKIIHMNLTK